MGKTIEELQAELATKDTEIADFKTKLEGLETKVTELNSTIVAQEEAKTTLEGQITELNSTIAELEPFKIEVETAKKEKAVAELSSRYEKLLSEDVMKTEEVQKAIQELNETELNSIVVAEIAKEKIVEVSSKPEDGVVTIVASKQEDLITKDKHEFWASPRS